MTDKALATLERYNMLEKGKAVIVALSGGADSVALLHFLAGISDENDLKLSALHLNHQLRGRESGRDQAFVAKLCQSLKIPLTTKQIEVKAFAAEHKLGIEEAGRQLRYELFEDVAAPISAKVATAHTASDNAETMLINLIRGTALRGLAGIPPVRGRFIRPLIACTRREIESYCKQNSLPWMEDSTNRSLDYTRNRVRHRILPLLEGENVRLHKGLTRLSNYLREDADYLDGIAGRELGRLTNPNGEISRELFLSLHPAIRGRVLAEVLQRRGILVTGELIDGLTGIIISGHGGRQLSSKFIFSCGASVFSLSPVEDINFLQPSPQSFDLALLTKGKIKVEVFPGKMVTLALLGRDKAKKTYKIQKKGLTYCLDYDKIVKVVNLRGRLPGDRLRLPGRGQSKTLKNLFQESGVRGRVRNRAVVLADALGPVWVEGFGVDERAVADATTERVVEITLEGSGY